MKIGIITFYNSMNYGAVLQNLALAKTLEKFGDAEVIRYYPIRDAAASKLSRVKAKTWSFILDHNSARRLRVERTRAFAGKIPMSKKLYESKSSLKNAKLPYDIVFAGSDQIWNPNITRRDDVYLLSFVDNAKKVSFASSFGISALPECDKSRYAKLFAGFDKIAVREPAGANIVNELVDGEVEVLMDPTVLLEKSEWDVIADEAKCEKREKYVLCYHLSRYKDVDKYMNALAARIAKTLGIKLIHVGLNEYHQLCFWKGAVYDAGPEEFISLIRGAECVVTNSFHGTIFSCIFEKPFFSAVGLKSAQATDSRIVGVLNRLSLSERMVNISETDPLAIPLDFSPDFTKARKAFSEERERSLDYIKEVISDVGEDSGKKSYTIKRSAGDIRAVGNACTGCGLCERVCPKKAIKLEMDASRGFLYPKIDDELCVGCGICLKSCPTALSFSGDEQIAYAAKHKKDEVRTESSSGGVFTAISDDVIKDGGVVYGTVLTDDMQVKTVRAQTIEERDKMRGSKYVMSDISGVYDQIADDLKENRRVLFTGVPCQVAAVRRWCELKRLPAEKLLLCEIFCKNAGSPLLWKEHVNALQNAAGDRLTAYLFRDKQYGWGNSRQTATMQNTGDMKLSPISESWMTLYNLDLSARASCFECDFCGGIGAADMTMGDFWGVSDVYPEMRDELGVSVVITNTQRGRNALERVEDSLELRKLEMEQTTIRNRKAPRKMPGGYERFWLDYQNNGYEFIMKKYLGISLRGKIVFWIKQIKRKLRKV